MKNCWLPPESTVWTVPGVIVPPPPAEGVIV
jgi:hypothetical protein